MRAWRSSAQTGAMRINGWGGNGLQSWKRCALKREREKKNSRYSFSLFDIGGFLKEKSLIVPDLVLTHPTILYIVLTA